MNEAQWPSYTATQKKTYWVKMGLSVREGMAIHEQYGHLDRSTDGRGRPWGNVPEHCLVQAARVEVLGRWIGLPEELIKAQKMASFLHDSDKKAEILAIKQAELEERSTIEAMKAQERAHIYDLKKIGFSDTVIKLVHSAGGQAAVLFECKRILEQSHPTPEDWAFLVNHYVDDYSIGSNEVTPSSANDDGNRTNSIDWRIKETRKKAAYVKVLAEIASELHQDPYFQALDASESQAVIDHQIEQRLANLIAEKTGEIVNPLQIPELIDQRIKVAIAKETV